MALDEALGGEATLREPKAPRHDWSAAAVGTVDGVRIGTLLGIKTGRCMAKFEDMEPAATT